MKTVNLVLRGMFFLLLAMGFTRAAHAIEFVGKMAIGNKTSELIISDRSFKPAFTTLDLSLTGTIDRYFVTFNNETSIKDDIESGPDGDDPGTDPDGLIFYSREDLNITFGYSFDIVTAFVGYRQGETRAFYSDNNSAFGTTSKGYYAGVSKSHYFKGKGSLSGSFAIASLKGEVSLSEPFVDTRRFVVGNTPPDTIKGSAIGYSIGIGWQGQISADTIYSLDYKINLFGFDDDVVFGGLDLSYEENFSTLYIGLTHFFE